MTRFSPARLAALAAAGLALFAGCQVQVDVTVEAGHDGGGLVSVVVGLDAEALAQVPDLKSELRTRDLARAGWRVEGPTATAGGGAELRASRRFATPAGASAALRELSGPSGPFSGLRLEQKRSVLRSTTTLSGRVDLTAGLAAFSDPVLQERLGGLPLGVEPAALEAELGRPLADVVRFAVTARLPGRTATVEPRLGETVNVSVPARQVQLRRALAAGLSVSAAAALLVVLVVRRRRR